MILIDFNVEREVIEYLTVYHVLVGTVFRTSFKKDFSLKRKFYINMALINHIRKFRKYYEK